MALFNFWRKNEDSAPTAPAEEKRIYTAEDVTKDVTAMMLIYLNDMQQCVERKQMSDALVKEKQLLQSLGLRNTKNAQLIADHESAIAQYNANVDSFLLMNEAWKLFGNDVMIVRYDQFMQLLEKYNLVCGDLPRYKGYIPEKNLHEIARVKGMDVPYKFAVVLDKLSEVDLQYSIDELKKAARFPYRPQGTDALEKMDIVGVGTYSNSTDSMYSNNMRFGYSFMPFGEHRPNLEQLERERKANMPRFFIAAPVQEMEPLDVSTGIPYNYKDWEKRDGLKGFANISIQTRDPFFCSCTKYGVLIYSKWGDEAQDEIIKRYQTLSQTINN